MNRRQFAAVLAGSAGPLRSHTLLEAIVAPRTPQLRMVSGLQIAANDSRLFELRVYPSRGRATLESIFERTGIQPVWRSRSANGTKLSYLIPFDSLAARHATWTRFNADPEWAKIRSEVGRVSEIAIYRRYPVGRIFERSL